MAFFTLKETQNEKPNHDFSGFRMNVQQEQMWDTRGHGKKLKKDICRRDIKKFSFPQRCVEARNGLEKGIVHARTVIDMETEQHEHIRTHTHTHAHTYLYTNGHSIHACLLEVPKSLSLKWCWVHFQGHLGPFPQVTLILEAPQHLLRREENINRRDM